MFEYLAVPPRTRGGGWFGLLFCHCGKRGRRIRVGLAKARRQLGFDRGVDAGGGDGDGHELGGLVLVHAQLLGHLIGDNDARDEG
jgi:hypothetical protein